MIREAVRHDSSFNIKTLEAKSVVIKPNIVGNLEYSGGSWGNQIPIANNGVVTNIRIIKSIVKLIHEINTDVRMFVLEGSADLCISKTEVEPMRGVGFRFFSYSHNS
jgi:hypothetical protein